MTLKAKSVVEGVGGTSATQTARQPDSSGGGRRFRVYKHPKLGWDAVKIGFSWPGFIFTWAYAFSTRRIAHRNIILVLGALVPAFFGVTLVEDGPVPALQPAEYTEEWWWFVPEIIALYALGVVLGLKANEWREEWLADNGFALVGVFPCGGNRHDAIAFAKDKYQEKD